MALAWMPDGMRLRTEVRASIQQQELNHPAGIKGRAQMADTDGTQMADSHLSSGGRQSLSLPPPFLALPWVCRRLLSLADELVGHSRIWRNPPTTGARYDELVSHPYGTMTVKRLSSPRSSLPDAIRLQPNPGSHDMASTARRDLIDESGVGSRIRRASALGQRRAVDVVGRLSRAVGLDGPSAAARSREGRFLAGCRPFWSDWACRSGLGWRASGISGACSRRPSAAPPAWRGTPRISAIAGFTACAACRPSGGERRQANLSQSMRRRRSSKPRLQ